MYVNRPICDPLLFVNKITDAVILQSNGMFSDNIRPKFLLIWAFSVFLQLRLIFKLTKNYLMGQFVYFSVPQDGGTVLTRTIMMGGGEPTRTETIRQTTMPTEIIQKTITIEGDGNQLTAEELRDIISKHAGDLGSSEVVTTVRCGLLLIWTIVGVVSNQN